MASVLLTRRKGVLVAAGVFLWVLFFSHRKGLAVPHLDLAHLVPEQPSNIAVDTAMKPPAIDPPGFDWATLPQHYPVETYASLPSFPPRSNIPQVQAHAFPVKTPSEVHSQQARLSAVKGNFTHAWRGYREHAWLKDEVAPISGGYRDSFGGWGASLVDALGTLWIMDLHQEFEEAVQAIELIDFSTCALEELNVFETTIRYLGGFLSAHDLSNGKYPSLLRKATELGEMLYHAFDTPNRMPVTRWNFKAAAEGASQEAGDFILVAEIGSLSLEFTRLSQITKDPKYYDAIKRIADTFEQQQSLTKLPGMWPIVVDAKHQDFTMNEDFSIGGMADSLYEYLPKQHILMNGATDQFERMYNKAIKAIKSHVFYRPMIPDQRDILLAGQTHHNDDATFRFNAEMGHLACFAGGMVGLGAKAFTNEEEMDIAQRLVEGCLWGYESMPLGIMPEVYHTIPCPDKTPCLWDETKWHETLMEVHPQYENVEQLLGDRKLPGGVVKVDDGRYILRPEAIESVFYLYRLTGDKSLQERAWRMFESIVSNTITDVAHAELADCTVVPGIKQDKMESFWLAETLRYFYLIFADEGLISLDEYVLNTEAHPLRRPA